MNKPDYVNDPTYSFMLGNTYYNGAASENKYDDHDYRLESAILRRRLGSKKGVMLFRTLQALFFIALFFWWDEITEMAFIILR